MQFSYPGLKDAHQIKAIEDDGAVILLEDNSRWSVYSGFADKASKWSQGEMIMIKQIKDPEYPYKLINVHLNESVEVKLKENM